LIEIGSHFNLLPLKNVYKQFVPEASNGGVNVNVNTGGGGAMLGQVASKSLGHEHEEWLLPMDRTMTVIGGARYDSDDGLLIAAPSDSRQPMLFRLDTRKSSIVDEYRREADRIAVVAKVFGIVGVVSLFIGGVVVLVHNSKK
jgi:hypothetical protein